MDRMVHVALNSLQNLRLDQRINAQNLANMNVAGFRKDLPASRSSTFLGNMEQFESRFYVTSSDKMAFSGEEGLVRRTEGKLDFALRGPGYFFIEPKTKMPPALSRRGDFSISNTGELVDGAGNFMLDNNQNRIKLPESREVIIDESGAIFVEPLGSPEGTRQQVGILGTTLAENIELLKGIDGNIRGADGTLPIADQQAQIVQGSLEGSNVDSLEALLKNIEGQRTFELNVKFISQAKDLDEATTRIMRLPGS